MGISFDGVDDKITTYLHSAGDRTIYVRFKTSTNFSANAAMYGDVGRAFIRFEAADKVVIYVSDGSWKSRTSTNVLNDGAVHSIIAKIDSGTNLSLYVDGVQNGTSLTIGTVQNPTPQSLAARIGCNYNE